MKIIITSVTVFLNICLITLSLNVVAETASKNKPSLKSTPLKIPVEKTSPGKNIPEININNKIEQWDQDTALYKGNLKDLSRPSKRAIVIGDLNFAIEPYLNMLNTQAGAERFGASSLYQIFLIYIDPYNKKRNQTQAKKYFDRLIKEYPDSEEAKKALKIQDKYGISVKAVSD